MRNIKVNDLKSLVNQKRRYEKLEDISQGFHQTSIFVLVYALVMQSHTSLFLTSSFGAIFFGLSSNFFENKSKKIKLQIKEKIFK